MFADKGNKVLPKDQQLTHIQVAEVVTIDGDKSGVPKPQATSQISSDANAKAAAMQNPVSSEPTSGENTSASGNVESTDTTPLLSENVESTDTTPVVSEKAESTDITPVVSEKVEVTDDKTDDINVVPVTDM